MRSAFLAALLALSAAGFAQSPTSVTVPITLDHNRIVIDVYLPLPDGTTKRIRGWVDNGSPDFELSRRAATLMNLKVSCDDKICSAPPPPEVLIGGMKVSLSGVKEAKIPLKPVSSATVMAAGMSAEINLPATVLRNYDVLVDFPEREFTLAAPGTLKFKGVNTKVQVNSQTGLILVPSQMENKKYSLGLDLGSSFSFLSGELAEKLLAAHTEWPSMTGSVGHANLWGLDTEPQRKILRVERLQYGPVYLTGVAAAELAKDAMEQREKLAGATTAGFLGSNALLNYRIGIDYARSVVYFDIGSTFKAPDFDVVGLVLRPEDDGRYTVLAVANIDGQPSVAEVRPGDHLVAVDGTPVPESTMGQVWSMLEGQPGQERRLTLEREGKQFMVPAKVQHFLAEQEDDPSKGKGKKKK